MAITYEYTKNGGILVIGKDHVSGSEIKEINEFIYGSPENILKIKYQLWDLTNVTKISISIEDIKDLAEQDCKAAKINSNLIIAIVAGNDLICALGRIWMAHTDNPPFERMVFRNIEDAEKWIDEMIEDL